MPSTRIEGQKHSDLLIQEHVREFLRRGGEIEVLPPEIPSSPQKIGRCRSVDYWVFRQDRSLTG